jgi:hypothetical protein
MTRQRIDSIKRSLEDMTLKELQDMSDNLDDLISVLTIRQIAIGDTIMDRLDAAMVELVQC